MTAHKNISGTYHLSVADILQVVYQVCFSPSVEINQDGVTALIQHWIAVSVIYWMRLSIFVSFSRARRTGSAYFTDGEKPVSETQLKQKDFQYVFTGRGTRFQSCRAA